MEKQYPEKIRKIIFIALAGLTIASCISFCGCSLSDYSNESLFPQEIESVYVKMFDNRSFRRGIEYELTDALAKRIEAQAGYKIVSSMERADSVISGYIVDVTESTISTERETGRAMEKEVQLEAVVDWKNLKTGELLIDNKTVTASATFSEWQRQSFQYASALAANNMARSIVELMETDW